MQMWEKSGFNGNLLKLVKDDTSSHKITLTLSNSFSADTPGYEIVKISNLWKYFLNAWQKKITKKKFLVEI